MTSNQQIPMEHLEQRSPAIVKIVVISISALALICVLTLCACALLDRKPGPEISTALITTLGTLVGALTGLLANTKTLPALSGNKSPGDGAPTTPSTPGTTTVRTDTATVTSPGPVEIEVTPPVPPAPPTTP